MKDTSIISKPIIPSFSSGQSSLRDTSISLNQWRMFEMEYLNTLIQSHDSSMTIIKFIRSVKSNENLINRFQEWNGDFLSYIRHLVEQKYTGTPPLVGKHSFIKRYTGGSAILDIDIDPGIISFGNASGEGKSYLCQMLKEYNTLGENVDGYDYTDYLNHKPLPNGRDILMLDDCILYYDFIEKQLHASSPAVVVFLAASDYIYTKSYVVEGMCNLQGTITRIGPTHIIVRSR